MTPAQKLLSSAFRRESPSSWFHADFSCDGGGVVELHGGVHEARVERGAERTAATQGRHLLVIGFTNDQVLNEVDAGCREIIATASRDGRRHDARSKPSPKGEVTNFKPNLPSFPFFRGKGASRRRRE
jgi:very-short-patch-repair endonuclease